VVAEDVVRDARVQQRGRQDRRRVQELGQVRQRYSTLEFQDPANLDDGEMWPVSFALTNWSSAVEKKVAALVKSASS